MRSMINRLHLDPRYRCLRITTTISQAKVLTDPEKFLAVNDTFLLGPPDGTLKSRAVGLRR